MVTDFAKLVSSLPEEDQDILACANVLGISPLSILKVDWSSCDGRPCPIVSIRVNTVLKNPWREGKIPWTKENLPQEKTEDIEKFIQRQSAARKWR